MDNNHGTLRATVRGFVQGVGFRIFVQRAAWRLGLGGYVRNMSDGTVEVVAAGPRPALDRLLDEIRRGPAGARISAVEVTWQDGQNAGLSSTFEVRH